MRNLVYFVATTIDGYITTASDVDPDFLLYDGPQAVDLLQEFPETIPDISGHLSVYRMKHQTSGSIQC